VKHSWRRIGAFVVDYGVILIWMAALFALAGTGLVHLSDELGPGIGARLILQGQAFILLTLPVYLYFTLFEALGRKATIGKRVTHLYVDGSVRQIVIRNALKFAPWEIAHAGIWHGMATPFQTSPSIIGWVLFAIAMSASAAYLFGLFMGSGQPLYDRIAGTRVKLYSR
jgi:uncharacterized RDD family membrane protein YckC